MRDKLAVKVDNECNEFIELSQGLTILEDKIENLKLGYFTSEKDRNEEVYLRINMTLDGIDSLNHDKY